MNCESAMHLQEYGTCKNKKSFGFAVENCIVTGFTRANYKLKLSKQSLAVTSGLGICK